MKLKVVSNTVFKQKPVQSFELNDANKEPIPLGSQFSIRTYEQAPANHLKVSLISPLIHGKITWYVFAPHVELEIEDCNCINNNEPTKPAPPPAPAPSPPPPAPTPAPTPPAPAPSPPPPAPAPAPTPPTGGSRSGILVQNAPGCSTFILRGLSLQLIDEINRLQPGVLTSFADLDMDPLPSVFAYLQPTAKEALRRAIRDRRRTILVNSAYRTIAQQLMLYNQSLRGQCGIWAAAPPGQSNHQSGLAIDIEDHHGWRPYLEYYGWRWLGSFDPPHFDYVGWDVRDIRGTAILAFQRLWNRHNPNDRISEDGAYGPQTEARLNRSPIQGF